MSDDPILAFAERQEWLAPIQEKGEQVVKQAYGSAGDFGQTLKNAMHGVWLGHPLHSAITDVPIGSWTAAAVLDVMEGSGRTEYQAGADGAIAVGLVGAVGSAISGLTDWSDVQGKPQRVGALHGLINFGATALYGASYVARKCRKRGLGRALAFAGFGLVAVGSYLGGALAYRQRIGVDHAANADEDLPRDFSPIIAEHELQEGKPTKATLKGTAIFLLKRGNKICALGDVCSHQGGPLSEGEIEGDSVRCPWHGSRFCLKTGAVLDGPAVYPQPKLDVIVKDGQVLVKRSAERREPSGY